MSNTGYFEEAYTPISRPDEIAEEDGPGSEFPDWYLHSEKLPEDVIEEAHCIDLSGSTSGNGERRMFVADWMEGLENDIDPVEVYNELADEPLDGGANALQVVGLEEGLDGIKRYEENFDGLTVCLYDEGFLASFAIPVERYERIDIIGPGPSQSSEPVPFSGHSIDVRRNVPGFEEL